MVESSIEEKIHKFTKVAESGRPKASEQLTLRDVRELFVA